MTTSRKTTLVLLGLDACSTIAAFNIVGYYRGVATHFDVTPLMQGPLPFFLIAIYLVQGYRARTEMAGLDYTGLHIIASIGAMLATLLLTFVFIPRGYQLQDSRAVIALSFLVLIPVTLAYRHLLFHHLEHGRTGRSFLFVGEKASREAFRDECRKMGVIQSVEYAASSVSEIGRAVPLFADVLRDIRSGRLIVECIILRESAQDLPPDTARELMDLYFGGVPTYPLEIFHQIYWQKIPLYRLNPTWLFQEGFQIAREPVFERAKRMYDLVLAAAGLLLSLPVIAAAAAAIWLEDRGPIWFRQTRIGRNQTPFQLVKLRTMQPNDGQGDPYTRPGDVRVTRVGRFLRKNRLDELPQLWNVIRGEMSLIGPRAEWDRLAADYERQIPCYSYRHLVKPGITGWAQVNYPYGANLEDTVRKLEYDLYYIRHFSFLLDASIFLKTIQIMLFGKGAR